MPGGITNPVVGYVAFCSVKLAGYTAAGWLIARGYGAPRRSAFAAGATRTLIGMAVGAAWLGVLAFASARAGGERGPYAEIVGLGGLVPIRLGEWWLLIWLLFDRRFQRKQLGWLVATLGTLWSFALDLPAILSVFATGGAYVC